MHGGTHVATGLLLDGRGDDGGVGDASLVEAVRRRSHHVRGEAARHQAERAREGGRLTVGFNSEHRLTCLEKKLR